MFKKILLSLIGFSALTMPTFAEVGFTINGQVQIDYGKRFVKLSNYGKDASGRDLNNLYTNNQYDKSVGGSSTAIDELGKYNAIVPNFDNSWVGLTIFNKTDTLDAALVIQYYKNEDIRYTGKGTTKLGDWTAKGWVEWEQTSPSGYNTSGSRKDGTGATASYNPPSGSPNRTTFVSIENQDMKFYIGREKHFNKTTKGFLYSFGQFANLHQNAAGQGVQTGNQNGLSGQSANGGSDPAAYYGGTGQTLGQYNTDQRFNAGIATWIINGEQSLDVLYAANRAVTEWNNAGESTTLPFAYSAIVFDKAINGANTAANATNPGINTSALNGTNVGYGLRYNLKHPFSGNLLDLSAQYANFHTDSYSTDKTDEDFTLFTLSAAYSVGPLVLASNIVSLNEKYRYLGNSGVSGAGNTYYDFSFNYGITPTQGVTVGYANKTNQKVKIASEGSSANTWDKGLTDTVIDMGYKLNLGAYNVTAGYTIQNSALPWDAKHAGTATSQSAQGLSLEQQKQTVSQFHVQTQYKF